MVLLELTNVWGESVLSNSEKCFLNKHYLYYTIYIVCLCKLWNTHIVWPHTHFRKRNQRFGCVFDILSYTNNNSFLKQSYKPLKPDKKKIIQRERE